VSEHVFARLASHPRTKIERIPNGTNLTRLTFGGDLGVVTRRLSEAGVRMPTPSASGTVMLGVNETWARRSGAELLQAFEQALA
jgi:hypothetical protein